MRLRILVGFALAVIIGGGSGVLAARWNAERARPALPSRSATAAPLPQLLFVADHAIHDGDQVIGFRSPMRRLARMGRIGNDYLLAYDYPPQRGRTLGHESLTPQRLFVVDRAGRVSALADVVGSWDVNAEGNRVVGTEQGSAMVRVWDLRGNVVNTWRQATRPVYPVFAQGRVLISVPDPDAGRYQLQRWDPPTGSTSSVGEAGYAAMTAGLGGRWIGGAVDKDERASLDGSSRCWQVRSVVPGSDPAWTSCRWVAPTGSAPFDSNGDRVLVRSTGARPERLGWVDTVRGPQPRMESFLLPRNTVAVEWADNDRVFVRGARDPKHPERENWLRLCGFHGSCQVIAKSSGRLIVRQRL